MIIPHVKKGDALTFKAGSYNLMADAANYYAANVGGFQRCPGTGYNSAKPQTVVRVFAENNISIGTALRITGINGDFNKQDIQADTPLLQAEQAFTEEQASEPFVIAAENQDSKVECRAYSAGLAVAQVNVIDDSHQYVMPVAGTSAGELQTTDTPTSCRLLCKGTAVSESDAYWCVVILGGGAGGESPFLGVLASNADSGPVLLRRAQVFGNGEFSAIEDTVIAGYILDRY